MESIICIIVSLVAIIMLKFIFKINLKKVKEIEENKEAERITNKFPENIHIVKEMLKMLGNEKVKIEEEKDTKTSLYVAITNKIFVADLKNNYGRIQTIAHECIHSCQDRRLLMFNFIFSNFSILYFLTITTLTLFNFIHNTTLQLVILLLIFFIQVIVRSILEIDAMTKSKFLAKDYIEKKNLCSEEELNYLMNEYEQVNKLGIPFMVYTFLLQSLIKIIIYSIMSLI